MQTKWCKPGPCLRFIVLIDMQYAGAGACIVCFLKLDILIKKTILRLMAYKAFLCK